jgi:hypothetical protein
MRKRRPCTHRTRLLPTLAASPHDHSTNLGVFGSAPDHCSPTSCKSRSQATDARIRMTINKTYYPHPRTCLRDPALRAIPALGAIPAPALRAIRPSDNPQPVLASQGTLDPQSSAPSRPATIPPQHSAPSRPAIRAIPPPRCAPIQHSTPSRTTAHPHHPRRSRSRCASGALQWSNTDRTADAGDGGHRSVDRDPPHRHRAPPRAPGNGMLASPPCRASRSRRSRSADQATSN